ncbi:MAG: T9SS type A sorting domain-containing protein [Saprospiraceae bacterium]|nr:T9SS type A sorting domain-containing protein [Saprospiraceae bacterium]
MEGLQNLKTVQEEVRIQANYSLPNLSGLDSLQFIGGDLGIHFNPALTGLGALSGLQWIGGGLFIEGNGSLHDLSGLQGIDTLGGPLWVSSNDALIDLAGLDDLHSIGGNLTIAHNDLLTNLDALSNLTQVPGFLRVYNNDFLPDLSGLENLTSIDGYLEIGRNDLLANIDELSSLDPITITDLRITENPQLSVCEQPPICAYLAVPDNPATVEDNAPGCNSSEEVKAACGLVSTVETAALRLKLYPNPTSGPVRLEGPPEHMLSIQVVDQYGRRAPISPLSERTIDLSGLPSGIYTLIVRSETNTYFERIHKS